MSDAKHTALPWRVSDISRGPSLIIECPGKYLLVQTLGANDKANAEFIVRACNSHDELLACCQKAVGWLLIGAPIAHDHGGLLTDQLAAAIAKAMGEPEEQSDVCA